MATKSRGQWVAYYDGLAASLTGQQLPPVGGARFLNVLKSCAKSHQLALWDRNNKKESAGDAPLAEAEHYLWGRLMTTLGGPLLAVPGLLATVGYDTLKLLAYTIGGDKALRVIGYLTSLGKSKTSRSSPGQIDAGGDGLVDGLAFFYIIWGPKGR